MFCHTIIVANRYINNNYLLLYIHMCARILSYENKTVLVDICRKCQKICLRIMPSSCRCLIL